ncbi:MAG: 1-acyl-sn-glycerol-3-phosphate acyltransferase [Planctomycetaceae bacterium]|nr:1-acyl-sn-glycerol-3-phosphate acyltransferase [Planctomycetaceae bacterium]
MTTAGNSQPPTSVVPSSPTRPWHARVFYRGCHMFASLLFAMYFRLRIHGREHLTKGGMLICCNHQSHLDPVLVGLACREPITYLARDTLFQGLFAKLITYLGAIPIQRDGLGLAGVKRTLERLKIGEKVLIFPEGTRTPDGQLQSLKGGLALIAKRSKTPILPMAIAGAFDAWPRRQKLPAPQTVQIVIGPVIPIEVIDQLDDQALTQLLESEIRKCWEAAKSARQHRIGSKIEASAAG